MRLFIAFDVPEDIRTGFMDLQKKLKYAKFNPVREFHLTLKFLGEVDEKNIKEIESRLENVKFGAFNVNLGDVGFFPSEGFIRVVWVGLEPHDKIMYLHQMVDDCLKGMFSSDAKFHPHLTLARIKFIDNKKEFKDNIRNLKVEKARFSVTGIKLIKSTLTPEGPIYEVLKEIKAS